MNKYLKNILTISATTLMALSFGGIVSHTHIHASCTTALDKTKSSRKTVVKYVKRAQKDNYVGNNADDDAFNFVNDDNEHTKLFNHYYLNPCEEKQYKVATVGDLARYTSYDPDAYAYSGNQLNKISHSINHNEFKIYNDETYYDDEASPGPTFIDLSAKSDGVPLTTNPNILKKIKGINKSINRAQNYDDNNIYICLCNW